MCMFVCMYVSERLSEYKVGWLKRMLVIFGSCTRTGVYDTAAQVDIYILLLTVGHKNIHIVACPMLRLQVLKI